MKNNIQKNKKGFTLIETLVAITIMMIAIAGPLTVANKGYTSTLDAKNQSIAINLAQEGLEYLNYIKDNQDWGPWVQGSNFSATVNSLYSNCKVDAVCSFSVGNGLLAIPANFNRTFYFIEQIVPYQISAIVTVTWQNGTVTNSVTLEQILTNYER